MQAAQEAGYNPNQPRAMTPQYKSFLRNAEKFVTDNWDLMRMEPGQEYEKRKEPTGLLS